MMHDDGFLQITSILEYEASDITFSGRVNTSDAISR